ERQLLALDLDTHGALLMDSCCRAGCSLPPETDRVAKTNLVSRPNLVSRRGAWIASSCTTPAWFSPPPPRFVSGRPLHLPLRLLQSRRQKGRVPARLSAFAPCGCTRAGHLFVSGFRRGP